MCCLGGKQFYPNENTLYTTAILSYLICWSVCGAMTAIVPLRWQTAFRTAHARLQGAIFCCRAASGGPVGFGPTCTGVGLSVWL